MKIYVASSWKNAYQPDVVNWLMNACGHQVYDYRNPCPGNHGFSWRQVNTKPVDEWSMKEYQEALKHPVAVTGFSLDFAVMCAADIGVLVLPSGNDAHLEAGYFIGAGKPLIIYSPDMLKPGLMYKMATHIFTSPTKLQEWGMQLPGRYQ